MNWVELMAAWGYICDDPDCTATHVNIEDIVPLQFTEEISDGSSG